MKRQAIHRVSYRLNAAEVRKAIVEYADGKMPENYDRQCVTSEKSYVELNEDGGATVFNEYPSTD